MQSEQAVGILLGVLHSVFVKFLYHEVPEPYMDEEFHVNQTRTYCSGDFTSWNQKITTPPALYLLALPLFCNRERYINSLLFPLCFLGLCRLRKRWMPISSKTENILTALVVVCLPVLLDTSFLFYTDMLSLTSVVLGFGITSPTLSALVFFVGVLTRQTNIVWAAMYCFLAWWKTFDPARPIASSVKTVLKHIPFAILAISFAVFVVWNKGIVLGDKSAHQPVLHVPQFFYFLAFVSFSSLPLFVSKAFESRGFVSQLLKHPFLSITLFIFTLPIIKYFTFAHPYLLADNRHFPFYLWRRFFAQHWLCKFSIAPVYLVSLFYALNSIDMPRTFAGALVLGTCACVIPAFLLEFRYFIIPFALWRLCVVERRKWVIVLELLWCLCINCVSLYLFVRKPFSWPHQAGVQRFMW